MYWWFIITIICPLSPLLTSPPLSTSQAGAGVKHLHENDWVVPLRPFLGTWRSLLVTAEKELLRIEPELMPMEQCAVLRESLTAYRLLEDAPGLRPGDCVALNAANSAVGQMVVQLAALLRLRTVAVIATEDAEAFAKTRDWLLSLGATVVLPDRGSLKTELDKLKFFAKPKLALDAVGGLSTTRLSDALADGGQLVVYGCMSGKSPVWPWHTWVFQGIQVNNMRGLLGAARGGEGPPCNRARVEERTPLYIKHHGHLIPHRLPSRSRASTSGAGCRSTRKRCRRCWRASPSWLAPASSIPPTRSTSWPPSLTRRSSTPWSAARTQRSSSKSPTSACNIDAVAVEGAF